MNAEQVLAALELGPIAAGLPFATIGGRQVTVATAWSAEALAVAARRRSALVVVTGGAGVTGAGAAGGDAGQAGAVGAGAAGAEVVTPAGSGGAGRPWPIVAVTTSPWIARAADLGLLVGATGPADHDGLDEATAAALVVTFLDLAFDGAPRPPTSTRSLLELVPFGIDSSYAGAEVLEAIVDGGRWVEFDAGSASEIRTGVARIGGRSVGVAVSEAGVERGVLSRAGVARVERLVRWCEAGPDGGRPLVSLVDTDGAEPWDDAAGALALRDAVTALRRSAVVKVAVVMGRAVGLGATVLGAVGARADLVLPWPRARFGLTSADAAGASGSAWAAAREADVVDLVNPDDTRGRIAEALELFRGARCYAEPGEEDGS